MPRKSFSYSARFCHLRRMRPCKPRPAPLSPSREVHRRDVSGAWGGKVTLSPLDSVNCVNTVTLLSLDTGTLNRYPAAHG
jgi:hypothetical protein